MALFQGCSGDRAMNRVGNRATWSARPHWSGPSSLVRTSPLALRGEALFLNTGSLNASLHWHTGSPAGGSECRNQQRRQAGAGRGRSLTFDARTRRWACPGYRAMRPRSRPARQACRTVDRGSLSGQDRTSATASGLTRAHSNTDAAICHRKVSKRIAEHP